MAHNIVNIRGKIHNKFHLQLLRQKTGEVIQEAFAENVVTIRAWSLFFSSNSREPDINSYVVLGEGSGQPAATDTQLFKYKFSYHRDGAPTITWDYPTSSAVITYTIPASSDYVGNLTEIGLDADGGNNCCTHAMLVDSEGQSITIAKTELDILIVTAVVYATITSSDPLFTWVPPADNSYFRWALGQKGTDYFTAAILLNNSAQMEGEQYLDDVFYNSSNRISQTYAMNYAAKTKTFSARFATGEANLGVIQKVLIEGYGAISFPNSAVFAPYTVKNIPIISGDGSTTRFKVPFGKFIRGSEKIYINGVLQDKTTYQIDHWSNGDARDDMSMGTFGKIISHDLSSVGYSGYLPFFASTTSRLNYGHWSGDILSTIIDLGPITNMGEQIRCNYLKMAAGGYSNKVQLACADSLDGPWETVVDETWEAQIYTFEEKSARYWKLTLSGPSAESDTRAFLGYTNPTGLIFNTPPTAGAAITMDCDIEYPYKSENYVLSVDVTLHFTFG